MNGDGIHRRRTWMTRWAAVGLLVLQVGLLGCDRSEPIVVIQLHPKNPDIMYVTTNDYIYKSRDGGRTWTNISKGMSHSRVIAMAVDPSYPATVYAGTKGDAVYKSYDGGQRWVSMRPFLRLSISSSSIRTTAITCSWQRRWGFLRRRAAAEVGPKGWKG